ncbi:MAG: response regulator [Candidatus Cloacimonetes bacterium]|nr:response regulator [Candidatus Cloacimonadota bacterium]
MNTEKPVILLVDDVPDNLKLAAHILKPLDCEISAAANGKYALDIAVKLVPDIILLDVMLPDINGFEVCRKLKADPITEFIPIIFLTARNSHEDVVKGFEVGAVDYVTKPFNSSELFARVKTHLTKERQHKEILRLNRRNAALAMAVTASHEITQPLQSIMGYLELLEISQQSRGINPKEGRYFASIKLAIERCQFIISNLENIKEVGFDEYTEGTDMAVIRNPDQILSIPDEE